MYCFVAVLCTVGDTCTQYCVPCTVAAAAAIYTVGDTYAQYCVSCTVAVLCTVGLLVTTVHSTVCRVLSLCCVLLVIYVHSNLCCVRHTYHMSLILMHAGKATRVLHLLTFAMAVLWPIYR